MDLKLEVLVVPVSDVDRAKEFYTSIGFQVDGDYPGESGIRAVQLTPPGSPASIIVGSGLTTAEPGSLQGLHLIVDDIVAARDELAAKGLAISEVFHDAGGIFHRAGTAGRVPGLAPGRESYASFASFEDPDGNGWFLQEITDRAAGR